MVGKLAHRVTSYVALQVAAIRRSKGGAATVELALIIPMLLMVMVGATDLGLIINQKMKLAHAARAGTHYALVRRPTEPADLTKIEDMVLATFPPDAKKDATPRTATAALVCKCPDGSAVACDGTCPSNAMRHMYIAVTVEEDFETLFGYPLIGQLFHIKNDATVRID